MKQQKFLTEIIKNIKSKKFYKNDKIPIEVYSSHGHNNKNVKLKILLLNAPCNGFGDVVFAMKLRDYLIEWYPSCTIKIASTKIDNFKSLGEKDENLYQLKGGKSEQCRRFRNLSFVDKKGC